MKHSWLLGSLAVVFLASGARAADRSDKEVESAINKGLEYLHKSQDADGSWRMGHKSMAITSLCVMSFLSAGHVPGEGRYGDTVEKGVRWVLSQQKPNGLLSTEGREMYDHGISTLMLAEVVGMTQGKLADEVRTKLEKAITVIVEAQVKTGRYGGGWRYTRVSTDGDISVSGWQVMALRAAKNVGCDVPPESIDRAVEFILRCRDPQSGGFCYLPQQRDPSPARTGTGILVLELCGKKYHRSPEVLSAGAFLVKRRLEQNQPFFCYSVYYCAQATFQLGGNHWAYYRPQLRDVLLRLQRDDGSWTKENGPHYSTAMSILALTVEYRLLPIYQRGEEPSDKKE